MTKLILGVLLWSIVHLFPALAPEVRGSIVRKLGENPYKIVFALLMVLALYLIISGWRATTPEMVYVPPDWGRHAAALLVLIAFILFAAPYPPNNIKRVLRHPQLIGLVCWGAGHLLANGELRSLVLFGGLTLWALIEIPLINRREGSRERTGPAPLRNDVLLVAGGIVFYVIVLYAHPWLFGAAPFPSLLTQ